MCPGGAPKQAKMEKPAVVASLYHHHRLAPAAPTAAMANTGSTAHHHHSHYNSHNNCSFHPMDKGEEQENCGHCGSRSSLHADWAQGDKVCRECGVVSEERLMDARPEWREFNDVEDLVKGLPSSARSGLVPVDESRYLGGLQPTSLAKHPFGGNSSNSKLAIFRKKLQSTNRKLDRMMGQRHARALKDARVSRLVRKRQLLDNETDQSDLESLATAADEDIRPELEQILIQEEEDVNRMQVALNADKWSLRRAILLHGHHESMEDHEATESERDDLQRRLDSSLRKASADLYRAYQMLLSSSQRLELPDRVTHEATNMMCKYVARRDGFVVKGVSSRLATKKNNATAAQQNQAAESLREHNKMKQMGSLCAALLLLTARKLGWPRPLTEVCGCVQPIPSKTSVSPDTTFIKPKHCSRAMEEIKTSFPDYARSVATPSVPSTVSQPALSDDPVATINFVDYAVRKLNLPPVAEASIRALVWHVRQEQVATGENSGAKLSTMCASLAYFVCQAGSIMQRLALQAQMHDGTTKPTQCKTKIQISQSVDRSIPRDLRSMAPPPPKKPRITNAAKLKPERKTVNPKNHEAERDEPFDVFSHDVGTDLLEQKKEYEMRRVWDTWAEQTAWHRTIADVEQSSGVSGGVILSHYKSNVFSRRRFLLEWLTEAVNRGSNVTAAPGSAASDGNEQAPANILTETPLASTLLSHVVAAAPLLTLGKGKQDNF